MPSCSGPPLSCTPRGCLLPVPRSVWTPLGSNCAQNSPSLPSTQIYGQLLGTNVFLLPPLPGGFKDVRAEHDMPEVLPTVGRGDPGDVPVVPAVPMSRSQFGPVRRCAAGKGAPSTAMAREAPSRAPNQCGEDQNLTTSRTSNTSKSPGRTCGEIHAVPPARDLATAALYRAGPCKLHFTLTKKKKEPDLARLQDVPFSPKPD